MKWDMTKVVEEITMQAKENQEEFIFETIHPYCENILQMKINKEELNRIILRGVRPKGKWIEVLEHKDEFSSTWHYECSECGAMSCKGFEPLEKYCPNCGAEMIVEKTDDELQES